MHDIRLAVGLIGFLSVGIFLAGRRLCSRLPPRGLDAVGVCLLFLMIGYLRFVWGQLWIVNWIPLPSVIVLSNWFPLLLAALGAVVWLRLDGDGAIEPDELDEYGSPDHSIEATEVSRPQRLGHTLAIRRTVMMVAIVVGGAWSVMYFVPRTPPECGSQWDPPYPPFPWKICRQTNPNTCSAASSATMLTTLGIPATEQEMARLCLTRNGTTWLGLYHGLSTKLLRTRYRINFFESDIERLPQLAEQHPVLLCCKLDAAAAEKRPDLEQEGGWIRGTAHSVVYFGRFRGVHIIGDPSRGYEAWKDEDLQVLWTGQGLHITERPQQAASIATNDSAGSN